MLPIAIGGKRARMTPCTMQVNVGYVNGYIRGAVVYVHITWILYRTELGLCGLRVRWPVMDYR